MSAVTDTSATTAGSAVLSAAVQLDDKFVAGWNARDAHQLLALMTDDVVYDDASWPRRMNGHCAVRAFLESTWVAIPDLSFTHEGLVFVDASGTRTTRYWHGSGTHTGFWDPPGLKPTGRKIEFHGATFLESRDGKLCRIRVVYDVASIIRQLGVLPGQGSWAERLIVTATNAQTWLRRR